MCGERVECCEKDESDKNGLDAIVFDGITAWFNIGQRIYLLYVVGFVVVSHDIKCIDRKLDVFPRSCFVFNGCHSRATAQ